jgi:hypothetical protein
MQSNIINIYPGIRMSKQFDFGRPFVRIAPVFGITRLTVESKSTSYSTSNTDVTEQTREFYGGLAYGIFVSAGYEHKLADNLGLTLELFSTMQRYSPEKSKLTKYTENGVDKLPDMTINDKEAEFVDEFTNSDVTNTNQPQKFLTAEFSQMLSCVGLQIGLTYRF